MVWLDVSSREEGDILHPPPSLEIAYLNASFVFPSLSYPPYHIVSLVSNASPKIIFSESLKAMISSSWILQIRVEGNFRSHWSNGFQTSLGDLFKPGTLFFNKTLCGTPINIYVEQLLRCDDLTFRVLCTMDWKPFMGTRSNSLWIHFTTPPNKQVSICFQERHSTCI